MHANYRAHHIAAIVLVAVVLLLTGCAPDLVVTQVRLNSWDNTHKGLTARVQNRCSLSILCKDAGEFLVYFDGEEVPTSADYRPHISETVSSLAKDDSREFAVDFVPLQRPENNYLWNVRCIKVTADPKGQVHESNENNNSNEVCVPFSSELPIIKLDTMGATIKNEPKIPATMKIIYDPTGGRNFIDAPANDYDGRAGVELRGQGSAAFCKKGYGIETWDEANQDLTAPLLQLPPEQDWVLYGPYSDKTLMRNLLIYSVSNQTGRYAPRAKFVELFVNDPGLPGTGCPPVATDGYVGVYVLMEKIKRDVNRVNVTKLTAVDSSEPAVTGGYILKKDWVDPGDVFFVTNTTTGYGTTIIYVYPKCQTTNCDATAQQKAWIEKYMNDFETALKGANFADGVNGYAKYIDVDSFVDYYLLEELFKNSDGFRGSTYMYKDRSGKLKMGPLWDMDLTMGNVGWNQARPPEGWLLGTLGDQMRWWSRLLQDRAFAQKVADRWHNLRQSQFKTSNLHLAIDNTAKYLRYAQARNFKRWPILGTYVTGNASPVNPSETYGDVVQQTKTWIETRTTWIDNNVDALVPP